MRERRAGDVLRNAPQAPLARGLHDGQQVIVAPLGDQEHLPALPRHLHRAQHVRVPGDGFQRAKLGGAQQAFPCRAVVRLLEVLDGVEFAVVGAARVLTSRRPHRGESALAQPLDELELVQEHDGPLRATFSGLTPELRGCRGSFWHFRGLAEESQTVDRVRVKKMKNPPLDMEHAVVSAIEIFARNSHFPRSTRRWRSATRDSHRDGVALPHGRRASARGAHAARESLRGASQTPPPPAAPPRPFLSPHAPRVCSHWQTVRGWFFVISRPRPVRAGSISDPDR